MTRRRFLALSAGGAAAALVGGGGYGALVEPNAVRFTRHVARPRTRPKQREVTFVQVSDLHLQHVGAMHRRIAARVNAIRPDFVLFTGDSVDRRDRLGRLAELLSHFDPRTPKYAILGNWEHWSGVDLDELAAVYRAANCRLLVNESAVHQADGRTVLLTGLDDLVGGRPDPAAAMAGAPRADAHLLLAHCPEHRDRLGDVPAPTTFQSAPAAAPDLTRVALMLSGHTHAGAAAGERAVRARLVPWRRRRAAVRVARHRHLRCAGADRIAARGRGVHDVGVGTRTEVRMPIDTTVEDAAVDLERLCDAAASGETVIIRRMDGDAVAMIAASELSSLMETMHLIRSPKNALWLFTALERMDERVARRD
jgi:uncharacterized protein